MYWLLRPSRVDMSYLTYSCPQEASSSWEPSRRYLRHSLSPLMVMASTDTTSAQKRCKYKHRLQFELDSDSGVISCVYVNVSN